MRDLLAQILSKIGKELNEWWEYSPGSMICIILGLMVSLGGAIYVYFEKSLLSIIIWFILFFAWGMSVQFFVLYDRNLMDQENNQQIEEMKHDGWKIR